jgi:hypothetical protein
MHFDQPFLGECNVYLPLAPKKWMISKGRGGGIGGGEL